MFVEKYKIKDEKTQQYYKENESDLIIEDKLIAEEKVKELNTRDSNNSFIVESFIDMEEF